MRSQDHSRCSSHVVQGELLPKINDNIDIVLGLAVYLDNGPVQAIIAGFSDWQVSSLNWYRQINDLLLGLRILTINFAINR